MGVVVEWETLGLAESLLLFAEKCRKQEFHVHSWDPLKEWLLFFSLASFLLFLHDIRYFQETENAPTKHLDFWLFISPFLLLVLMWEWKAENSKVKVWPWRTLVRNTEPWAAVPAVTWGTRLRVQWAGPHLGPSQPETTRRKPISFSFCCLYLISFPLRAALPSLLLLYFCTLEY